MSYGLMALLPPLAFLHELFPVGRRKVGKLTATGANPIACRSEMPPNLANRFVRIPVRPGIPEDPAHAGY